MKKCTACNRIYDDSQSFCLDDGTLLITDNTVISDETKVLPRRKNRLPLIFTGLILLLGLFVAGWFLLGTNDRNTNQNTRLTVNVQTPAPTATPAPTEMPSPSPTPSATPETNTNVATNGAANVNSAPVEENNPAKTLPVIMKTEDHSVLFSLHQCRKSGSSITCDLSLTNKGADREFQLVIFRSNLYDELGNGYNGKSGQLANKDGDNIQINFISGVTTRAQIMFEGVEPNASKITLLRLQYDVGEDYRLEVKFRNVPLTISK